MPKYPQRVSDEDPDFDEEDDEDEDVEEFNEGPRKPKKVSKIQKKVVNPDADLLEEDIEERPARVSTPKKAGSNFVAFRTPPQEGIADKETGEIVCADELTFRAWVMNKLEAIHETIGKI